MSSYDEDNATIVDVMEERGLKASCILRKFRYQTVHGKGTCHCVCGNSWSSYKSSITIDLHLQEIGRYWRQKCRDCGEQCEMDFSEQKMSQMVHHVIDRYYALVAGKWKSKPKAGSPFSVAHESSLCERCGYGQTKCWLKGKGGKLGRDGMRGDLAGEEEEYMYDDYLQPDEDFSLVDGEVFQDSAVYTKIAFTHSDDESDECGEEQYYIYDDYLAKPVDSLDEKELCEGVKSL